MLILKPTCYRTFKKASQGQPIPSANFIYQKNGSSQDGYSTPNKGGVEFKAYGDSSEMGDLKFFHKQKLMTESHRL